MREIRARSSGHFNDEFVVRAHVCTSTQMADGERIVVFFIMAGTDKFN
jgi:peroxiredoxin family protein